jgi:S1-C subfamily serine protease
MEVFMDKNNAFTLLSDAMSNAVETGSNYTVLVNSRRRFPATGIVYKPDLIITADHVVENDEDIVIIGADQVQYKATLAGRDPGNDLALLRLEKPSFSPSNISQNEARVGQLVLALARPSNEGVRVSLGAISFIGGPVRNGRGGLLEKYIQAEVNPLPGFSGGPLIDSEGAVLGLNTSGIAGGILLTIPISFVWATAKTLAENGRIQRGFLGIRSQPVEISEAARKTIGREQTTGLLIVNVESDGPAAQSGLIVGDILVAINSHPVKDPDDLWIQLSANVVGQKLPVELLSGGQKKIVMVQIAERR